MGNKFQLNRRRVVAGISSIGLSLTAGCSSGDDDVQDSDGDGVIDSQDYAPNDPAVQQKSDLEKATTQTPTPTPTPTPSPTPTPTPLPDSDGDGIIDSNDDFPENADYSELVNEDATTEIIKPGYYTWLKWSLEKPATFTFELEVVSGSHVDALLIDESEFSKFEAGEEYSYYVDGSDLDTVKADKHLQISAGTYRFILSNWSTGTDEASEVDYYVANAR